MLGGCGFIGSHVTEGLLAEGYRVTIFDKGNVDTKNIVSVLGDIELIEGDFSNVDDLRKATKNKDYVFHFIGTTLPQSSTENPVYDIGSNIIPTINLLELVKGTAVKKLIFSSSGGTIYGVPRSIPIREDHPKRPISAYGISKLIIEKYLHLYHHLHGLDYISLRLSNVYGERQPTEGAQGAVAVFLGNAMQDKPISIWGDGSAVRDYVYIKDAVNACVKAAKSGQTKEHVFNIGSGTGLSLTELLGLVETLVGRKVEVKYGRGRKIDVPANILDITLAREVLEWQPKTAVKEGLKATYDHLQRIFAADISTHRGAHKAG